MNQNCLYRWFFMVYYSLIWYIMKKEILLTFIAIIAWGYADACTNLIVGKKASKDGAVLCSYSDDSYGRYRGLCHYPAGRHAAGEMRKIIDWGTLEYRGEIPEAAETYNVIGNINEYQVCIGETTYGGRKEMVDTCGLLDYGSLIYIALQRSRTAREAISVMTTLAETYGYCSSGESFSICDADEAWIMEMMGKGPGSKGVVWVAQRIPDDCISGHANQSRITYVNIKDRSNVMMSKDCIRYARKMGWFAGKDNEFSWADTYAPSDFHSRRICDARVWSFFNHFCNEAADYLPWAMGTDEAARPMPLWMKPDRLLGVEDVEAAMRDHYEGTPMSLTTADDPGKGLYDAPYRPTPLAFEYNGEKYLNERPISTQQTVFVYVAQLRSWLPRQIGGVLWFGNDDANMVAFTPVYCSATVQPECYNAPGVDDVHFSEKSAYWMCNMVSNMVYQRYSMLFHEVQTLRDRLEQQYFSRQPDIERQAADILTADGEAACATFLNDYSVSQAQSMLAEWQSLALRIIVKYNDSAIKPDADGKFRTTQTGLGVTPVRPGYTDSAKKAIASQPDNRNMVPHGKW